MHIDIVPNRTSPPAVLLRESYREGGKVKKRTLANLSSLPMEQVELLRRVLKGEALRSVDDVFEIVESRPHGHAMAVHSAMRKLGLEGLLGSRPSRQRDLIMAMVASRVLAPRSKLATARAMDITTIPALCGIGSVSEDDLYEALDWLGDRQDAIEKKLAARHLEEGGMVLYDLTSTYYEGRTCPLAVLGYNRDGKKGKLQINFGLLTDKRGCPVSVSVFPGNTGDPKTLLPQVQKVRDDFGINDIVLVGDRGMITQKQIDAIKEIGGINWITALRTEGIRALVDDGALQLGLFDELNLCEITHPDYPGELLVACRNEELGRRRATKRQSLLDATVAKLEKVQGMVARGRLRKAGAIGVRVGAVLNRHKMAKHFTQTIEDNRFEFAINDDSVAKEAALDGMYVVRSSVSNDKLDGPAAVRTYKSLSNVERAFRSIKTINLHVRPIYHWTEPRVRAHIFLCVLAYYVQWHMMEAWRPLLFADEDQAAKQTRDPVAKAKRSSSAEEKARTKRLEDGTPVESFRTLLERLATIVRNTCRRKDGTNSDPTFTMDTTPTREQQRALDLLREIEV